MAHSLASISTRGFYGTVDNRMVSVSTRGFYDVFDTIAILVLLSGTVRQPSVDGSVAQSSFSATVEQPVVKGSVKTA
jgi:hypothetical protein